MTTADLFDTTPDKDAAPIALAEGAVLLPGFVGSAENLLLAAIEQVLQEAPLRHMTTPGGYIMSVAMSNCGDLGWVSDRRGYRYDAIDPDGGLPWPNMPEVFQTLASEAAQASGYSNFAPDACLINCYEPGARLSLHQDKNERDPHAPIVSVSLGLPAIFLFGSTQRNERPTRYRLQHGDVVVWGGAARYNFHGVAALADGWHSKLGRKRINLTFRKAA